MAGRTLHQAMAYLGLRDQEEMVREVNHSSPRLQDEIQSPIDHFSDEDDVFIYSSDQASAESSLQEDPGDGGATRYNPHDGQDTLAPLLAADEADAITRVSYQPPQGQMRQPQRTEISYADANESEEELRRITTIHPRSYNDAKIIGESFRENIPVIMNVTDMGESEAKRLVDFSAGLAFALHGSIERVTDKVFLLTPANLEVLGAEGAEVPVALDSDPSDLFNQG